MINYKKLATALLDDYCDRHGTDDGACLLAELGYNKTELAELGFAESDIKTASKYTDLED